MQERTKCGLKYEHPKHGFQRTDDEAMEICDGKLRKDREDSNA